jgi:uncharacterized protein (TIGR02266 family)
MKTVDEQNQASRLKSQMRVYYGQSQDAILTGFSIDLSTGGLFLTTNFPLETDESLSLIFSLPDSDRSISCKARVAWTNPEHSPRKPELPAGVGVQFVDMSLEDMKTLKLFLEHNEIEPTW